MQENADQFNSEYEHFSRSEDTWKLVQYKVIFLVFVV